MVSFSTDGARRVGWVVGCGEAGDEIDIQPVPATSFSASRARAFPVPVWMSTPAATGRMDHAPLGRRVTKILQVLLAAALVFLAIGVTVS
ncbi:MAG: hypothetical protein CMJ23_01000 [Phycisphaerae bacterium]|nr:hypothetical protein [Phycisphaerae bacterium]